MVEWNSSLLLTIWFSTLYGINLVLQITLLSDKNITNGFSYDSTKKKMLSALTTSYCPTGVA